MKPPRSSSLAETQVSDIWLRLRAPPLAAPHHGGARYPTLAAVTRLNVVSLSLTFSVLLIAGVIGIGIGAVVALILTLRRGSSPRRG
jgi:hypothetical protein